MSLTDRYTVHKETDRLRNPLEQS